MPGCKPPDTLLSSYGSNIKARLQSHRRWAAQSVLCVGFLYDPYVDEWFRSLTGALGVTPALQYYPAFYGHVKDIQENAISRLL